MSQRPQSPAWKCLHCSPAFGRRIEDDLETLLEHYSSLVERALEGTLEIARVPNERVRSDARQLSLHVAQARQVVAYLAERLAERGIERNTMELIAGEITAAYVSGIVIGTVGTAFENERIYALANTGFKVKKAMRIPGFNRRKALEPSWAAWQSSAMRLREKARKRNGRLNLSALARLVVADLRLKPTQHEAVRKRLRRCLPLSE